MFLYEYRTEWARKLQRILTIQYTIITGEVFPNLIWPLPHPTPKPLTKQIANIIVLIWSTNWSELSCNDMFVPNLKKLLNIAALELENTRGSQKLQVYKIM